MLNGGDGNDTIIGGAGNEVLVGGSGDNTFAFNFNPSGHGHDVIEDFQVHGTSTQGDVVRRAGFSNHSFDQAPADGHIAQSGSDVVIFNGTNIVATLQNISLASLQAQDFMFAWRMDPLPPPGAGAVTIFGTRPASPWCPPLFRGHRDLPADALRPRNGRVGVRQGLDAGADV